jgi:hypothetical protein
VSHEYQVHLYDTTGARVAIFDEWNSVYFFNRISDYGYHTISIDGADPRTALFTPDSIIEVLRRDREAGIAWYPEYRGLHRTGVYQISDRGSQLFSSYGRGFEDFLHRRVILWRPGDVALARMVEGEYSGAGVPADNVMRQWVREQLLSGASTGNGRLATGTQTGFAVGANLSAAPTWEGRRSFKNLLDVLKEVGQTASVDFDVAWGGLGTTTFTFTTYYPRIGTDRTGAGAAAPVTFAVEHANMSEPYLTTSRMEEVTAVYVAGTGQSTDRTVVEGLNAAEIAASPWNRIEAVQDARNESTTAGLTGLANGHLAAHTVDQHIAFQVLQSPGTVYGRDYFRGDLVLARFLNLTQSVQITGAEITVAEGKENIRIHFGGE